MELAFLVYLISFIGNFKTLLLAIAAISSVVCLVSVLIWMITWGENLGTSGMFKRSAKISVIILMIACLVNVFVPTEKTSYLMVAAYATQKVSEKPETKEVADKVLKIINGKLDGYIKELENDKQK